MSKSSQHVIYNIQCMIQVCCDVKYMSFWGLHVIETQINQTQTQYSLNLVFMLVLSNLFFDKRIKMWKKSKIHET